MTAFSQDNQLILADAHVHIYDCFNLSKLLNSAWNNFQKFASKQGCSENFTAVLFLTEIGPQACFKKFLDRDPNQTNTSISRDDWTFHPTQEGLSLYASKQSDRGIFLIAGRQIVTAENLEVLALITDRSFEDGLPLEETIEAILSEGGIPVLPWGVGKWMGSRGKLLNNFLEANSFPILFLGDNSGRPIFWRRPFTFQLAEKKGLRILPGTDPLPLASEFSRPGSFGFTIQGSLSREEPGKQIKQMLLDSTTNIQAYGSLETPLRFIRNQLAIRYKSENKQTKVNKQVVSTNGFPETADIETSSEDYASRFAGEIGAWLLKVQEEATLKMLAPYPKTKVLDVGGGHGQITGALIKNGYQVTVVGSADICKARIQNFIDANLCEFKVGNVLDLPYPEGSFDVAIAYRFLAHVTQWESFLSELNRVAKQAVIVDYPTVRSVNAIAPYLFKFKKGLEGNTREFICYQEHELLDFFKSLGLSKANRYPQFFLPMVLHRTLKSPGLSATLEGLIRLSGLTYLFGSPVILKVTKN